MSEDFDVVIVGGGITGSAMGIVLARSGVRVKVLERDRIYQDRVRGEFMASWGVKELQRLGLADILTEAGGIFVDHFIPYDENIPAEMAEKFAFEIPTLGPDIPATLCMGHPAMCEALNQAAMAAGAEVVRGVKSIKIQSGGKPSVSYKLDDEEYTLQPKLLIGADGRNSVVQRQLNFEMQNDPPHNLLGGMLVEGKTSWPQNAFTAGTEGNIHFLIFPQGKDRLRLYLCYDFDDRARFTGPDREKNLLEAFRLKCLPMGEEIAQCKPISAFHSYSNEDHWTDNPTMPGIVLIGDAAGHYDPITGQGLSIGLRDVRIVSDILAQNNWNPDDWNQTSFAPYVEERQERMRRLRVTGRYITRLRAEFGEEARQRRARASHRTNVEGFPSPSASALIGPEALPAENYEQSIVDALFAP